MTSIERNDFAPAEEGERLLFINRGGRSVEVRPDNPKAGAVAYLCVTNVNNKFEDGDISLSYGETKALRDALSILLLEAFNEGQS